MVLLSTKKTTKWTLTSEIDGNKYQFTTVNKNDAIDAFKDEIVDVFKNIDNAELNVGIYQIGRFDITIDNANNPDEQKEITLENDNLDFTNDDKQQIKALIKRLQIR